jgi:hypothetical protein
VKLLAAVLIVSAIWLVLASVREGRGRSGSGPTVDVGDVWLIEQHDPVVRLGRQASFPAGHPLAPLSADAPARRG